MDQFVHGRRPRVFWNCYPKSVGIFMAAILKIVRLMIWDLSRHYWMHWRILIALIEVAFMRRDTATA